MAINYVVRSLKRARKCSPHTSKPHIYIQKMSFSVYEIKR